MGGALHPYRKRSQLNSEEVERLYAAMLTTLSEAIEKIRVQMGEAIQLEPREFMNIHMKTGQPCPRCGDRSHWSAPTSASPTSAAPANPAD